MSRYTAIVHWERQGQAYTDRRYSRRHTWRFDGGAVVMGSSSPQVVPVPMSDPTAVDPEEAFVASLSSCHLLWFLDLAQKAGFVVDDYRDEAEGLMAKDGDGRLAITRVTLRPVVRFSGHRMPDEAEHQRLHEAAHGACYIAHSVRSEVLCEPSLTDA
jgi:organic hydroperoxide reductase OsmC/OhrA